MSELRENLRQYEDRWEDMDGEERLSALQEALRVYTDMRIDGAYDDGIIHLCEEAMFCGFITMANMQWWRDNGPEHGIAFCGWRCPEAYVDVSCANCMEFDDALWLEETCWRLVDYPIIDEDRYYELEAEAFEDSFREEFFEGGELAPEWQDIGEDEMRELCWQHGELEDDWFYINVEDVKMEVAKVRLRNLRDLQLAEEARIEEAGI